MWSKHKTSFFILISLSILFSLFWFLQPVALVVFISLLLTILLNPIVDKVTRKKIPRLLSAAIVLFSFLSFIIVFLLLISKTFIPALSDFITDIPHIAESLKALPFMQYSSYLDTQLEQLFQNFAAFSMTALKSSLSILLNIFSKFLDFIIIIFVTFYLLKDGKEIKAYLANLFPKQDNLRVTILFNKIIAALGSYIRGQLTICLITGVFVFLYFTAFNLPYSPVFAVLSAVGEFIPVVGPTIASAAGTLLAFTVSPGAGVQLLCFYILLTQINHNVIYPYLIGKSLNLHPAAIMIGILLGGELLGPIGMFLAVPCMVIIKLVIEDIAKHKPGVTKAGK